jgi:transcriptional regulator with GAF, ATPase, and Fis domain
MDLKRDELIAILAAHGGSVAMAAHTLGTLTHLLSAECERLGIDTARLPSMAEAKAAWQRAYLERLLEANGGNVTRAAESAGMTRQGFADHCKRAGVDPDRFKPAGRSGRPWST